MTRYYKPNKPAWRKDLKNRTVRRGGGIDCEGSWHAQKCEISKSRSGGGGGGRTKTCNKIEGSPRTKQEVPQVSVHT